MILSKSGIVSIKLTELVESYHNKSELEKLVFIVPTNRSVRELRMKFITTSATQSIHRLNIDTLQSMAVRLLDQEGISLKIIDDAAAYVFLRQAVGEIKSEYFKPYKGEMPEGVQKRLLSVFAIWKRENITSVDLLAEAENFKTDYEKNKLREIVEIFERYQQKLKVTGYADTGDVFRLACSKFESLPALFGKAFPDAEFIVVQGFSEFAALEVEFVSLLANIPQTQLFLDFDYHIGNKEVFGCLDEVYQKFQTRGFVEVEDAEPVRTSQFVASLKSKLFVNRQSAPDGRFQDQIQSLTGRTLQEEVQIIAREVKRLCTEEKVQPSKICVLFNLIDQYAPVVRDTFHSYGLPLNLTDRPYLRSLLPVIDILSYFEILIGDFYYKNLFKTFSAGLIPLEKCSVYDFQWVAEEFNVIGGRKYWMQTLKRAKEKLSKGDLEKYDLERVERVTKAIEVIAKTLDPFRGEFTPAEFRMQTRKLIAGFNFISVMRSFSTIEAGKVLGAVSGFLQTLDEVTTLLELEHGTGIKKRLSFYLKNLQQALSFTRFTEREPQRYGITVTTPNEARGLKFDYVFIGGLFDGNFPSRFSSDLFTPEKMAKSEQRHLYDQQYAFYQSLETWNKQLYLSYPLKGDQQELMPSRFLASFKRSFVVTEVETSSSADSFYSHGELLKAIGKGAFSAADKERYNEEIGELSSDAENYIATNEGRRIKAPEFASYNGVLDQESLSEDALSKLAKEKEKYYSISQFESYAGCPYKYYSERVLRLQEIEEPEEEADSRTIGSILHDILDKFLSGCVKQNIKLSECDDTTFHAARKSMFAIAKEVVESDNAHVSLSFWDRERILGINGNEEQSILFNFLKYERQPALFAPALFETSFGKFAEEQVNPPIVIDELKLRGKIDRIDVNEEKKIYTVIDYKTGSAPKRTLVEDGVSLQLPIYLEAAKQVLEARHGGEFNPSMPEIYQLKTKVKALGRIFLGESNPHKPVSATNTGDAEVAEMTQQAEAMMKNAKEKIVQFNSQMQNGVFPVEPYKKAGYNPCRFCTYAAVCRISELEAG